MSAESIVALIEWGLAHGDTLLFVSHVLMGVLFVVVFSLGVLMGGAKVIAAVWVWKQAITYARAKWRLRGRST